MSVNLGDTVQFKVQTDSSAYQFDIYRVGYYGGDGAAYITSIFPFVSLPQFQPPCLTDSTSGLLDCGNWAVSASWTVPKTLKSGVYFAKVFRQGSDPKAQISKGSHIFFVVRDDSSHSDIVVQTSDATWQAYNLWGGASLYSGAPAVDGAPRPYKVSYNRPITTRDYSTHNFFFNAEYPMIRWLEANGYDVTYISEADTDRSGTLLLNHKIFISSGHDEYWSGNQRSNVEAARSAGVNLAFFSGNEIFWKTRWEPSISSGTAAYRTLVSYKETHANAVIDPMDPPTWTGSWRDPTFSPPADGGRPENGLSGTIFTVNCCTYTMTVPADDGKMRFWRNTPVASQPTGSVFNLTGRSLGYEWDEDLDNGFRPAGLIRMSTTTVSVPQDILDYGNAYGPGTATHHLTLYRYNGTGLVFGAGTVQWAYGLDSNHDNSADDTPVDLNMQQATVNLFADMGVQPANLQSGLVAALQSSDRTPPRSVITFPSPGRNIPVDALLTISGTATDSGGGVVAGIEVSVDGGKSWHPATGRSSWTFSWTPFAPGSLNIESRAIDDSGNIQSTPTSVSVNVLGSADKTLPTVSIAAPTANQTVTGSVTVSATASDNVGVASVQFKVDGVNIGPPVTSTQGNWASNWITNQVSNGVHNLTALARDGAGNVGTSGAISVIVSNDKTPPTVSLTAPTANTTVSGSVIVAATASDNVAVANVQFQVDGANLGSPVTSPPYQVSWDTSTVITGSFHTLTALAADTTGNLKISNAITVTVGSDSTPPSVSITSPTANQTVTGTIPVAATASDNVAVASVQFKLDGANLGAAVTSAPYQINWNTTSATNASHSLTAVATDTSNNSTTS